MKPNERCAACLSTHWLLSLRHRQLMFRDNICGRSVLPERYVSPLSTAAGPAAGGFMYCLVGWYARATIAKPDSTAHCAINHSFRWQLLAFNYLVFAVTNHSHFGETRHLDLQTILARRRTTYIQGWVGRQWHSLNHSQSTIYADSWSTALRVFQLLPHIPSMIIIRCPVDVAFSNFVAVAKKLHAPRSETYWIFSYLQFQ